jgi:hypothetical protein
MTLSLREHQKEAVKSLHNGSVLYGAVGTGKSRCAVAYYLENETPRDIYVITTAKKRDSLDWEHEFAAISVGITRSSYGRLCVDSFHNIGKYVEIEDAFFIFDEQRLVGNGSWVKAFKKLAPNNHWIMLSGTPGDSWMDYVPLFIANGFYKNVTQFKREHVRYDSYSKYPKISGYLNEGKLQALRNHILVEMPFAKHTIRHLNWMDIDYDKDQFKTIQQRRWNIFEDRPLKDAAEMLRVMRRAVNTHPSRLEMILRLQESHKRLIVFYNFDYELEILRTLGSEYNLNIAEWNGHKKQPIPSTNEWVYLVQYVAGAEGWNCIETDAICHYSLTYSYKNFEQTQGRIDRLNTPYTNLYYYPLVSDSFVDRAIRRSLERKKNFNEKRFAAKMSEKTDDI